MNRQGWEVKKLGEVTGILMGQSPPSDTYNLETQGLPFFQGNADFGKLHPKIRMYCTNPVRIADAKDILISVRAPIGSINIAQEQCCIGRGLASIRAIQSKINYKYIYHTLSFYKEKLISSGTGSTFKAINRKVLTDLEISIPPLSIQKKIVNELDTLSSLIEKKKKQLAELDTLTQATFYEMFGDLLKNNYPIKKLEDVFSIITDGTHQTPTYTTDTVNGFKFLSSKDVVQGKINWDNIKYIPKSLHEELYRRLKPQKNDILLAKNGTTGIAALVDTDDVFDIYVSLALLRPRDGVNPIFLLHAINNPDTKYQFNEHLKGVGVPNLHLKEIRKTKILIPHLPLQIEFAKQIEAIEQQKALIEQSIVDVQILFDSTMDKYFH